MAPIHATNETEPNVTVSARWLVLYGLFALVAVCLVNVLILFIGLAAVEFPSAFVGGPFGPLAVAPVVVNSAVAAVGATIVYGVVTRYAAKPNRTFVILAGVMLVLSFAMFLAPDLAGAPVGLYAFLAVMHVSAAIVIVGILTRAGTTGGEAG